MLKREYLDKLDTKYSANIHLSDHYAFFNAINDSANKIIIDLGTDAEYIALHMIGSINLDISKPLSDKHIFNTLFKCISIRERPELYVYCRYDDQEQDIAITSEEQSYDVLERIQRIIWKQTLSIIPIYAYNNDLSVFYEKYFPFLCETGAKKPKYLGCDGEINIGYPNQIIDDKLYLGNIKHAINENVLRTLGITHIVNCTPIDYDNFITEGSKQTCLQIRVSDHDFEDIAEHFDF